MSVAMSPVISESCEYKQNVAESTVDAGNPPQASILLHYLAIILTPELLDLISSY